MLLELVNDTHSYGVVRTYAQFVVRIDLVDDVVNIGGHVFVEVGCAHFKVVHQINITDTFYVFRFRFGVSDGRTQTEIELVLRN